MMISEAVAVTFGSRTLGMFYWLMPLSVAVSTFGTANGTIFAAGRLCYVASREGHLMNGLSFVHKDKLTPAPALLLNGLIAAVMVLIVSILLMICPIIDNPKIEYIYSILFTVGGALTYVPFVRYNVKVPFLSKITQFLQMIFKCTPVAAMPDWPEC